MRLVTLASLIRATAAVQMVHLGWQTPSDEPLKDITFPMSMPRAPRESGYYFEQAVAFRKAPQDVKHKVIYIGLQPRPDKDGKSIVHATFSSFFPRTTVRDGQNCRDGADNGPGVSCAVDVPSSYNDTYHLRVQANKQTYTGTLINRSSGQTWPIGSFDLPCGVSQMMGGSWLGFVEYYKTSLTECSEHPKTAVTFGTPFTSTPGVDMNLTTPYKDKNCGAAFRWKVGQDDPKAYEITIG
ncbi:uncharacterized protein MAM_02113 [Metarhizium album ARSEF 1941]|uniref:Uncharacterized protein n=1 Tax=Metarhizium album (strain ARSEF 1941) TaxID=1081103 RepID=A0A0B2X442_METAS|nr:uncharacterized protein MAM_02113 [Metarhizium album ARSEF 1941]KHO00190.1 hypothetical protein MAM_02113 [Metarhizium album ARSEF 1941]